MAVRPVTLDERSAHLYLRLLGVRHASLLSALAGFAVLASGLPDAARTVAAWLFVLGLVGFGLSVSVLVIPVARRVLAGTEDASSTEWLATMNLVTGHTLVDVAKQTVSRESWVTRRRLRTMVLVEVALFVSIPLLAVLTH